MVLLGREIERRRIFLFIIRVKEGYEKLLGQSAQSPRSSFERWRGLAFYPCYKAGSVVKLEHTSDPGKGRWETPP